MKKFALLISAALLMGAALIVKKVSDYPNVTVPGTNDFFLLSITNAPGTNHNIKYSALKAAINATNLTLSVNATNANTPNLQDSATVTWSKSGSNLVATAAGGNVTNTYNTIVTTNLTVLNSLTVSNITVTNVTVQNNLTVSNLYTVNGNHNTLIVTNYVQMPWTTLTLSGTNVSALNLAAGTMFKLTLTNNAYFGVPSGLPGTSLAQSIQLFLLQDGTGTRTVTMTNSAWILAGSGASTNAVPTINTNANGVTVLTFVTSPFSSTLLYGVPTAFTP